MGSEAGQKVTLAKKRERVEEAVAANNAREQALSQRSGIGLHPLDWVSLRLETFFETILGERRYLDYVEAFQNSRSDLLTQMEEQAARDGFGLSRPSASKKGLVIP